MSKSLKIFNIRDGFANNSSSTHSIIFRLDDEISSDDYDSDFGWDFFTVNSKDGILDYLRGILNYNLILDHENHYIECILNSWVGPSNFTAETLPSIDHQSAICLPRTFDGQALHKEFFLEFKDLLLNNNTLILGGNDNDDENHRLAETPGITPRFLTDRSNLNFIAKKDYKYDYWTLFNRNDGYKIRCVINENGQQDFLPKQASTPDLVDVKITQYCNFGCKFCYQGSTKSGTHADFSQIKEIINTLADAEVFEIAYGGGEPTQHPEFIDILKYTRKHNIVPNFTTRDIKWLKNNIEDIKNIIGSCAVSIGNAQDIKKIRSIIDYHELPQDKICVQIVMGTESVYNLENIVKTCCELRIPLTLLGFKTTGFGANFKQIKYNDWIGTVTKCLPNNSWYKIGVDTALIQQSEEDLKKAGVPEWLYHKDEGVFSWYIDAVDHKMGPSSYDTLKPYSHIYSDFEKQYDEYGEEYAKNQK